MEKEKVSISWSGGKDATFALYKILKRGNVSVENLHTTMDAKSRRVGLHEVSEHLLEMQAQQLGFPLKKIYLEENSNRSYEEMVLDFYDKLKGEGIHKVIYGDIFLEELRHFKERLAHKAGIELEFPLWGIPTNKLIEDFIETGFKTLICAVDGDIFSSEILGKTIDMDLIKSFPKAVDPCGENGEFHTFTYAGPIFQNDLALKEGNSYSRNFNFLTDDGRTVHRKYHFKELASL